MFTNRSRITTTIWVTLVLAAGFALWHILPDSIRNAVEPTARAAIFTVNTADDHNDGVCNAADCTLREAINAANAGDTISFNIPGAGVHTINATSGFSVMKAVTIDGTSQSGFAGSPLIELNGAGAGTGISGFSVNAPNVTIKGLIINRFSGYGINFDSFGGDTVQGCYVGPSAAGTSSSPNVAGGIRINAAGITIGGTTSGAGNVISGNRDNGIDIVSGSATVLGNFIGTNAVGNGGVQNTGDGVNISGSAGATIGGTVAGARNVICSSASGIVVSGGTTTIQGNFVGLFVSGIDGPGNGTGIKITGGSVTIGGTGSGAGNVILSNSVERIPGGGAFPPEFGAGVYIAGGSGTLVQGNLIGTNSSGTTALVNEIGVLIDGSANNVIGGTTPAARNIISGNNTGIEILNIGATNNVVQGNFIGTDITGSKEVTNGRAGVWISTGSSNNLIGGATTGARNIISGNHGSGVFVTGGSTTQIQGNYIGLNAAGTAGIRNGVGVIVSGGSATVGGAATGAGNVISGNNILSASIGTGSAVYITGGTGSQVSGNFIGTNPAGTVKIPNRSGVVIDGAANNVIGGTTAAARNVISGNTEIGVGIVNVGATNNVVMGNFIGTDISGTGALGNNHGVEVGSGAQNNTIGGTTTGAGNTVEWNTTAGVSVTGGNGTSILGNLIGLNGAYTDVSGIAVFGVSISGGSATVGGTEPGSRNVIWGNSGIVPERLSLEQLPGGVGIRIFGGTGSQVIGNSIGINPGGIGAPGYQLGVIIEGVANNIIGGTTAAARNTIAGAVRITGAGATNNIVQGNTVRGDGSYGVSILGGASNNTIGGTTDGAGNAITSNGNIFDLSGGGVFVESGTGNAILGNSIFSNSGLGIDLSPPRVTANDNCDTDTGANNLQNFPVIASAIANSTTTTIQGTLNSTANTQFRIEFFANPACDPSGNGEGQTFLGFTNVKTDVSCNASFTFSVPNVSVTGPLITATATDSNNNTSEFSACATLVGIFPTIQFSAASYTVGEGDKHVDVTITRTTDASAAASVSFATSDVAFGQICSITDGKASSRCDYETRLTTVTFAPGQISKTISVSIIEDSYVEGPETFTVKLSDAVGVTLGAPFTATVTITDNDLGNGHNAIDAPDVFVRTHYLDFLNREPDQGGFDFWTNQITSCGFDQACIQLRRINVSAAFFLSIEFQQNGYFVERIYKAAYGDDSGLSLFGGPPHYIPVPSVRLNEFLFDTQEIGEGVIVGQSGWETVLENNQRAFILDFVQRSPFLSRHSTALTPTQFVDRLFANAGLTPSDADRKAALAEFGSATDISDASARVRALRDVAENSALIQQEFNRAFVLMEYFGYLRRNPNDDTGTYTGYDFWLTKLNQFNGDFQKAEMVKAFISSTEYRQRFGP